MMWKVVLPALAAVFTVGLCGLIGGPVDVPINSEGVENALNFAVAEHNRQSNGLFLTKPQEVVNVQRQVVSGYKYIITVKMGKTPCRKNNVTELCAIPEDPALAQTYLCTFTVWEQPWLHKMQMMKQTC
ncbi:cystatin C (amyloid angiopathy and cerebral hemorrhage) [Cheilinus undulatus]|uniref:cystatin C (amyloid angiopathy and cerebral hemorrhage) n=1 Tax=Cheilinus undulatus TaxID=241271 RepID=UPI001BD1FEE5|nr:cystatin C (amyloid angiopathy and cerebral hemorrhage) [Cheilinus undulatus]